MMQTKNMENWKVEERRKLKKMLHVAKDIDVLASVLQWNEGDRSPSKAKPLIEFFVKFSKGLVFKELNSNRTPEKHTVPNIINQFETLKQLQHAKASALNHLFEVAKEAGFLLEEESVREVKEWSEEYYKDLFFGYFSKKFFQGFIEYVERGEVLSEGMKQGVLDLLDVNDIGSLFDFDYAGWYMLALEDKKIPNKYTSERWGEMLRVVLEKSFGIGHIRSQEMFDFSIGRYLEASDEPIRLHVTIPEGIETPDVRVDFDGKPEITVGNKHFGYGCDLYIRLRAHDYALFLDGWVFEQAPDNFIFGESYIFSPSAFEMKGDAPVEVFENIRIYDHGKGRSKNKHFEVYIRFE